MTAVLSSNIALSDKWSLNNSDTALLTRVRVNDFSCQFGDLGYIRLQGAFATPLFFYQIEIETPTDGHTSFPLPGFKTMNLGKMNDHKQDMRSSSLWVRPESTTVSTLHRLCPLLITHWLLISIECLQYWPCGRGLRPCPCTELTVIVGHCLPFVTDLSKSIRALLTLLAEVKCLNADLIYAFSLNDGGNRDALWTYD